MHSMCVLTYVQNQVTSTSLGLPVYVLRYCVLCVCMYLTYFLWSSSHNNNKTKNKQWLFHAESFIKLQDAQRRDYTKSKSVLLRAVCMRSIWMLFISPSRSGLLHKTVDCIPRLHQSHTPESVLSHGLPLGHFSEISDSCSWDSVDPREMFFLEQLNHAQLC